MLIEIIFSISLLLILLTGISKSQVNMLKTYKQAFKIEKRVSYLRKARKLSESNCTTKENKLRLPLIACKIRIDNIDKEILFLAKE